MHYMNGEAQGLIQDLEIYWSLSQLGVPIGIIGIVAKRYNYSELIQATGMAPVSVGRAISFLRVRVDLRFRAWKREM